MGKILVIKGADFSNVAVGKVDPTPDPPTPPTGFTITLVETISGKALRPDGSFYDSVNYTSKKYSITGSGTAYASGRSGYSSNAGEQTVLAIVFSSSGSILSAIGNTQREPARNWVNEAFVIPEGTAYVIVSGYPAQQEANLSTQAED